MLFIEFYWVGRGICYRWLLSLDYMEMASTKGEAVAEKEPEDTYWEILKNGFPTSMSIIFELVLVTINLSRISDSAMKAGLGLSGVLVHCLGSSFIFGFNYGYGIFSSSAFGAKNYQKFKEYFVQGLTNASVLTAIFVLVCFFSYQLSILAGQEQIVSVYTYNFIVYILPGYICFYSSHFVRLFINSQNIYSPNLFVDASGILLHIIVSWILSYFFKEETLIYVSTNITLIGYFTIMIMVEKKYSVWKLSMDLFNLEEYYTGYKEMLKECCYIGIPYALGIFIFEIMALYVGSFKNTAQTAAHVILTNIVTLMVSPYLGFNLFMTTRVGNFIGENRPGAIFLILKKIFKLSLIIIYCIYAFVMIFLDEIVSFYTQDQKVAAYIKPALKLSCIFFLTDIIQNAGSQFYKPLGFGSWVTKVYTFSFYLVGFGSTLILTKFLDSQIFAAWGGLFVGCITLSYFCLTKIREFDMRELVCELNSKVKIEKEIEIPLNDMKGY